MCYNIFGVTGLRKVSQDEKTGFLHVDMLQRWNLCSIFVQTRLDVVEQYFYLLICFYIFDESRK
jgi:hypothetical protein